MAYTYDPKQVKVLDEKSYIKEHLRITKSNAKLFGVKPAPEKIKELKQRWKNEYKNILELGCWDIGTIAGCFIKIKNIVLYQGQFYVKDEKNVLYRMN